MMSWGVLPLSASQLAQLHCGVLAHHVQVATTGPRSVESMCCAMPLPRCRSLTAGLPPRLRTSQGQLATLRYVGRRTFLRSGAALPAELSPRVGTIFLGLIGLGFISTMIGVSVCLHIDSAVTFSFRFGRYEFYSSFAIWPEEVRADLRAGVKAKQQGNLALSRKLLTQCVLCGLFLNCY